ncbi:MAG: hypothetical protein ACKV19_28990 [Verrucomicrobiales bacterium]
MGFSDSATYLRSESISNIERALAPRLKDLGFVACPEYAAADFIASYEEPQQLRQSLEVDTQLIDELVGYDFGSDMQEAIAGFEASRFGTALESYETELESYYEGSEHDSDAKWHYKRQD